MTKFTKILSVLLCLALVVAIAVFATGCANKKTEEPTTTAPQTTEAPVEDVTKLGQGEKEFTFIVKDDKGTETKFLISSNAETVGAALIENNLIAGEESEYGLYVKTVNGVTLDYDTTHTYWAFYVNGEYASGGVESTGIIAGTTYSFVATAA